MSEGNKNSSEKRFKRRGFQFLGLGGQDVIRYFFGGNASLAIIVLVLICVFLLKEGFQFFPSYQHELAEYRKTGQEYVDYVSREVDAHTRIYSQANIAYYAEVNQTSVGEDEVLSAYRSIGSYVRSATSSKAGQLERYEERVEDLKKEIEKAEGAEAPGEEVNLEEVKAQLKDYEGRIEKSREAIQQTFNELVADSGIWSEVRPGIHLNKEEKALIKEAVLHKKPWVDEELPAIVKLTETSSEKKKAAAAELEGFKAKVSELSAAARPLKSLYRDLKSIAAENAREAGKFSTAGARYEALLEAAKQAEDPAEKKDYEAQANAVDRTAPEFEVITRPLVAKTEEHNQLSLELEKRVEEIVSSLPGKGDLETESARENIAAVRRDAKEFSEITRKSREEMKDWKYDKPVSWIRPVVAFFTGKNWISNSSWRDFYELLPLFTGSMLISIIALAVAVPFALAAAIYVNQLAPLKEQNFIKPAIEFIEAIPSVVLGFFGILVLGTALRTLSQVEWLSWVPGFPMSERLTILNAGLLLALMAVPTIFTLAEDALNNVPQALTENSLAMGASKIQTVLKVVFPASISGIIAAVLLGFGRIVGETMVVLLVAGNKIKVPDFTKGIGVVTEPAHTMTGIIAQELGEVDNGSLHWRALFMVGLVLFFLSLFINFAAQRILKKLQKF